MAASRKRASTNQFRNVATTSPVKRAPSQGVVRDTVKGSPKSSSKAGDTSSKKPPRLPPKAREEKEKVEDEALVRIKHDFELLCSSKSSRTRRLSYRQRDALVKLASLWWPKKEPQLIPQSVFEFLLSKAPLAWSDTCSMPPFPLGAIDTFLPIFTRWITFTPGLMIVPVLQPKGTRREQDSVFLSTVTKNLRGSKCLVVIKISKSRGGKSSSIIQSQGWVLNLPRRSKLHKKKKTDGNITSLLAIEKDAAGMNKLSGDTHVRFLRELLAVFLQRSELFEAHCLFWLLQNSLQLESLLFDFSASMVERTARLPGRKVDNLKGLIPTIRGLIARHPFEQQKRQAENFCCV